MRQIISDLKRYVNKRKKTDKALAKDYGLGYANFKLKVNQKLLCRY